MKNHSIVIKHVTVIDVKNGFISNCVRLHLELLLLQFRIEFSED